jgi:hypothetical protein
MAERESAAIYEKPTAYGDVLGFTHHFTQRYDEERAPPSPAGLFNLTQLSVLRRAAVERMTASPN